MHTPKMQIYVEKLLALVFLIESTGAIFEVEFLLYSNFSTFSEMIYSLEYCGFTLGCKIFFKSFLFFASQIVLSQ